jgi:hypothetical protein
MPIVSRQTGTKLTIAEDNLIRSVGRLEDPVGAFIELAVCLGTSLMVRARWSTPR